MPFDRFGIKYLYPSKVGGYNWEQEDSPKSQDGVDWPSEMSFPSSGIVRMDPNGPTDWGIGKNIQGFTDSIGGCNMDFKETAARGYAYKADDARDVEIKLLIKTSGLSDNGFSISACTGHHKSGSGACCQGFAYMITTEVGTNPYEARFRKEMWHVNYNDCPIGVFKHPSMNFKIDGRAKWTGLGFCRYNDPLDIKKRVVVEAWVNPDPEADLNNWILVKKFIDEDGEGWGSGGDDCGGAKDAAGPWSNAQNRFKTNATNGYITAKCITLREIDPAGDFSTSPPSGGGATVTRLMYYGAISSGIIIGAGAYAGYGWTTSHEIVETQTDPDVQNGWWDRATGEEIADDNPEGPHQLQYPSGVWVDWYWSNSDKNNVIPGLSEVDNGSSTRMTKNSGARLLPNPQIFMIFWGTEWRDRVVDPTMAHVVSDVQTLLTTNSNYFSKLSQYGCGIPTWGGSCVNVTTPIPDIKDDVSVADIQKVIVDTFNQGLLTVPDNDEDKIYLVYIPNGQSNTLVLDKSLALGWHGFDKFTVLATPNPTPPGGGGGGGTGTGGTPSVPIKVTGCFTIMRDLNTFRGASACAGTGGGGIVGGNSKFYDAAADNDKELSNNSKYDNRTRIAAKLNKTGAMKGSILKQLDVPLKKAGSPAATPKVLAKIWDTNNHVVYTSPTQIDPTTLTTSYVTKSFDFSGNSHPFVIGDIVGVEYNTSSSSNYVIAGYEDVSDPGAITLVQWEDDDHWDEKTSRDFACTMWN